MSNSSKCICKEIANVQLTNSVIEISCTNRRCSRKPRITRSSGTLAEAIEAWDNLLKEIKEKMHTKPFKVTALKDGATVRVIDWDSMTDEQIEDCDFDNSCSYVTFKKGQSMTFETIEVEVDPLESWIEFTDGPKGYHIQIEDFQTIYSFRKVIQKHEVTVTRSHYCYKEILELNNGDKIKISIVNGKKDSREVFARLYFFKDKRWEKVESIPVGQMVSLLKKGENYWKFIEDRCKLLELANGLLMDIPETIEEDDGEGIFGKMMVIT